jgi:hypothetical protein
MVRGAGWREPNPRLRRREKNVLDIPLYRTGDYAQNPVNERNRDVTTAYRKSLIKWNVTSFHRVSAQQVGFHVLLDVNNA